MSKQKKIFKPMRTLAPKITVNSRWTTWRQGETKIISTLHGNVGSLLLAGSLFSNQTKEFGLPLRKLLSTRALQNHSSKIKNTCHYVGRARSVNQRLFMARHTLRKFVRFGMLPGFVKTRC